MATNLVRQPAMIFSVVCSSPTTPQTGAPVRYGYLTGVALTDEGEGGNIATETTVDFGQAVWDLSVKGVDDGGDSAVAVGDAIFYVDADTPNLSKKVSGYFFGIALETVTGGATSTINVLHMPAPGSGALATSGVTTTKIANAAVTAAKLTTTMQKGFIPLDISTFKLINTNAIINTTEGGFPDGNTTPLLERVNGATDIAMRVTFAANVVTECQFAPIPKPPDLDGTVAATFHMMLAKNGNTDNGAVVGVKIFDGVGDSNAGGNTAALAAATLAEYTVTLAHGDLGEHPGFLNVAIVPGTHANDAIYLYAAWIEYTRK